MELSEMEHPDVDDLLGQIRKKVIRGAKHTRHGRLKGAMRTVPIQHPTEPREYGRATLGEELNTMSLHDAIQRFRSVSEAAVPAPAPKGQVASGKQTASKSKFDGTEPKGQQKYDRTAATVPADAEAKAAATRSTAGVKGSGYDASGREKIDVRHEQVAKLADALIKEDESLGKLIGMCYEMAENRREFVGLVEKFVGAAKLQGVIEATKINADPVAVAEAIGFKKHGKMKFGAAAPATKKHASDATEGQDDFHSTPKDDAEDIEFAKAMLADKVGDLRRRPVAEANIPAPGPSNSGPDGKAQTASKSQFDDHVKPDKDYKGAAVSIPADAEAKAAAPHSTAGVSGPGYDASGREKIDVRTEQFDGIRPGEDADQAFVRQHGLA